MTRVIARLFVAGRPRTKGHMQPTHRRGVGGRPCSFGTAKDRPLTVAWMKRLNGELQRQLGYRLQRDGAGMPIYRSDGGQPYVEAVEIHAFFRFDRVQSEAEEAAEGEVWPSHDTPWPTAMSIGDEDTLRRGVLDALVKAGVIKDDSLSVGGWNYKRWCEPGEEPGVLIVVQEAPHPSYVLRLEKALLEGTL
jgi:hypothetical protein